MDYRHVDPERMVLRDHLARDRTELANERTLLAYVRTAMALFAAGGTLLKIFWGNTLIEVLGSLLLGIGLGVAWVGVRRFRAVGRRLRQIDEEEGEATSSGPDS